MASAGGRGEGAAPSKILRLHPETLAVQAEIPLERKGFGIALDDAGNRLYVGNTNDGPSPRSTRPPTASSASCS